MQIYNNLFVYWAEEMENVKIKVEANTECFRDKEEEWLGVLN